MKKLSLITLIILLTIQVFSQSWNEVKKAVASDRDTLDWFGWYSSIDGNYAIINATKESHDENGENFLYESGSAYIFELNEGGWIETQKIVASDRGEGDRFGHRVDISGDLAIISALRDGEDESGGDTLEDAGSAYIFERNSTGSWIEVQKIVASDRNSEDFFGSGVAIDGNTIIIGADLEDEDENSENFVFSAGSCYIFEKNLDGIWVQTQKIVASDRYNANLFGRNVSIDEDYLIVSAHQNHTDSNNENPLGNAGAAFIFEKNSEGIWEEVNKVVASDRTGNDRFGSSVSISNTTAIVSASWESEDSGGLNTMNKSGSAYVFERDDDGSWNEIQKLVASDRQENGKFGFSGALSGDRAVFGAYGETDDIDDTNSMTSAGAAYIFKRNENGVWNQEQKIVASDRAPNDNFGISVSITNYHTIVSSYFEDDDELGENYMDYAGSAYIFENTLALAVEDKDVNIQSFSIYPNPTNSYSLIDLGEVYSNVQLNIYNLNGQNINSYSYENIDKIQLSIEGPKGIYFIKIILESKETKMIKVIKN